MSTTAWHKKIIPNWEVLFQSGSKTFLYAAIFSQIEKSFKYCPRGLSMFRQRVFRRLMMYPFSAPCLQDATFHCFFMKTRSTLSFSTFFSPNFIYFRQAHFQICLLYAEARKYYSIYFYFSVSRQRIEVALGFSSKE